MTVARIYRFDGRKFVRQRLSTLRRFLKKIVPWKRCSDRQAYTLVEVLCVMSLLTVLMNATMLFVFDGRRRCREAMLHIEINQRSILLRKPWRDFIASLPALPEIDVDGVLRSGEYHARLDGNTLVVTGDDGFGKFDIPSGIDLQFHIEEGLDGAHCAVLVIRAEKHGHQRRIVACFPSVAFPQPNSALTGHDDPTHPTAKENH